MYWLNSKAKNYVFKQSNGTLAKDAIVTDDDGNSYYADGNGLAVTGWKKINGKYYYFKDNCTMAKDTTVDGYTIDSNGVSDRTD